MEIIQSSVQHLVGKAGKHMESGKRCQSVRSTVITTAGEKRDIERPSPCPLSESSLPISSGEKSLPESPAWQTVSLCALYPQGNKLCSNSICPGPKCVEGGYLLSLQV